MCAKNAGTFVTAPQAVGGFSSPTAWSENTEAL